MIDFYPDAELTYYDRMLSCYAHNLTGMKVDGTVVRMLLPMLRRHRDRRRQFAIERLHVDSVAVGIEELLVFAETRSTHLKELRIASAISMISENMIISCLHARFSCAQQASAEAG